VCMYARIYIYIYPIRQHEPTPLITYLELFQYTLHLSHTSKMHVDLTTRFGVRIAIMDSISEIRVLFNAV